MIKTLEMVKVMYLFLILCFTATTVYSRNSRKQEVMLPMRDGVKLHTEIFFPRDYVDGRSPKAPSLLDRSPYGYSDMEWITDIFLPFGFVAVGQDMRGTEKSEGNFSMWMSDADDGAGTRINALYN